MTEVGTACKCWCLAPSLPTFPTPPSPPPPPPSKWPDLDLSGTWSDLGKMGSLYLSETQGLWCVCVSPGQTWRKNCAIWYGTCTLPSWSPPALCPCSFLLTTFGLNIPVVVDWAFQIGTGKDMAHYHPVWWVVVDTGMLWPPLVGCRHRHAMIPSGQL